LDKSYSAGGIKNLLLQALFCVVNHSSRMQGYGEKRGGIRSCNRLSNERVRTQCMVVG